MSYWKNQAYAKLGLLRDRMSPEKVRTVQEFIEMPNNLHGIPDEDELEPAYVDVPIVDGRFEVPHFSNLGVGNFTVGKQFTPTSFAFAGYVYSNGEVATEPIGYSTGDDTYYRMFTPERTHYRRATHVRLVDLSKLQEVK